MEPVPIHFNYTHFAFLLNIMLPIFIESNGRPTSRKLFPGHPPDDLVASLRFQLFIEPIPPLLSLKLDKGQYTRLHEQTRAHIRCVKKEPLWNPNCATSTFLVCIVKQAVIQEIIQFRQVRRLAPKVMCSVKNVRFWDGVKRSRDSHLCRPSDLAFTT
jgi:hypothetical protein